MRRRGLSALLNAGARVRDAAPRAATGCCCVAVLLVLAFLASRSAGAQEHAGPHATPAPSRWSVSGHAVALGTYLSPALDGRSLMEGYLAQPSMRRTRIWRGAGWRCSGCSTSKGSPCSEVS